LLKASDLSILPSHEEGFSNVILESMAASLPVIATDVGGNREAVLDGITGWVVPPEDPKALVLTSQVIDYEKDSLRYSDDDDIEEQRLRLRVKVTSVNSDGEELINQVVTGESTYFLEGAKARSEVSAQVDLIDDTARRILELVVEDW